MSLPRPGARASRPVAAVPAVLPTGTIDGVRTDLSVVRDRVSR